MEAAAQSLFHCLEQIPDPRQARGVRHPFQAILRLTLLGLVSGQTAMAHIAWYGRLHGETLKEPLGFVRDQAPRRAAPHHPVPDLGGSALDAIATGGVGLGGEVGVGPSQEGGSGWEVGETVHRRVGEPVGVGERVGARPEIAPGAVAAGGTPLQIFDQSGRRCCGVNWAHYLSVTRGCNS